MELFYSSTRGAPGKVTASRAILKGLAQDGGLFMPEHIPTLPTALEDLPGMSYQQTAYEVMRLYLTDYTEEELKSCIARAYDEKFDTPEIAPLRDALGVSYLELFHGATIAFKDMALSILPHLMTTAAKKNQVDKKIVILTATSGDTGKAALAGFADVPGTKILVFYPKDGVSPIQERQMVTQKGANTCVVGIHGNFDDAQSGVKRLFGDQKLNAALEEAGYQFSSANSINIGRLVPQIVYYVYAYGQMIRRGALHAGEPMNVVVPTGNFGNILAAYLAKKMGLPISRLLCAANENRVLVDFFQTGIYDRNRPFVITSSPSMDILISSNLERLIYLSAGCDAAACAQLMKKLSGEGRYAISRQMQDGLTDFYGDFATEEETAKEIASVYQESGYVLDPHTAVASSVYRKYRAQTGDLTKTVIVSTASPFKFTRSVMTALGEPCEGEEDLDLADRLGRLSGREVPQAVRELKNAPVLHDLVVDPADMETAVKRFLHIRQEL